LAGSSDPASMGGTKSTRPTLKPEATFVEADLQVGLGRLKPAPTSTGENHLRLDAVETDAAPLSDARAPLRMWNIA
jgi:hypothetical protein